jgi:hypothetical protein
MLREKLKRLGIKCPLSLKMANYYLSLGYKVVFRSYRMDSSYEYFICKYSNSRINDHTIKHPLKEQEILSIKDLRELLSHQDLYCTRLSFISLFPRLVLYEDN